MSAHMLCDRLYSDSFPVLDDRTNPRHSFIAGPGTFHCGGEWQQFFQLSRERFHSRTLRSYGFHPAWKYETVFELILSHGYVIETREVSKRIEEIQKRDDSISFPTGVNATKKQMEDWVASTFKLNYNL